MSEAIWTPGTFDIPLGDRPPRGARHELSMLNGRHTTVDALHWKCFAVTPVLDPIGGKPTASFDLTHKPTGFRFNLVLTQDKAKQLAERVADLDWNFTDPANMPHRTRLLASRIRREFLAK